MSAGVLSTLHFLFHSFSVCFKCKIGFKTSGIRQNKKYEPKNSLFHATTKGGGGSPHPLVLKKLLKGTFLSNTFSHPVPFLFKLLLSTNWKRLSFLNEPARKLGRCNTNDPLIGVSAGRCYCI